MILKGSLINIILICVCSYICTHTECIQHTLLSPSIVFIWGISRGRQNTPLGLFWFYWSKVGQHLTTNLLVQVFVLTIVNTVFCSSFFLSLFYAHCFSAGILRKLIFYGPSYFGTTFGDCFEPFISTGNSKNCISSYTSLFLFVFLQCL